VPEVTIVNDEMLGAFYGEWRRRRPGQRRDLRRAGLLADALGVAAPEVPVLTVVGSKGKGTAATYASAVLAASGCRVVTVTSPGLRTDAERIRLDGVAISARRLAGLGHRIRQATASLPPPDAGYLSPSGLFVLAGLWYARAVRAGAVVLEAGMGGASDEVSLVPPAVVAITGVFAEHVGVLGDSPAEIAADKAAVATPATRAVVSVPQDRDVTAAIAATVAERTGGRAVPEVVEPGASGVEYGWPAGLGRFGAELGCVAARRLLSAAGRPEATGDRLARVVSSVILPGRCSWHRLPGRDTTVLVDSAIDGTGAAAALAEAYRRWDRIDHLLVCLPDHKDVPGVAAALAGLPVTYVRMPDRPHLAFTRPLPDGWSVTDVTEVTAERLAGYGNRLVVLGTVYFTGRILEVLDAPTGRLFEL
jgi:dihydrofolate synthase / folylpolyglutamate synthase